jgi:hypothetical protein
MSLRVFILQTFYPEFLADIYAGEPQLKDLDFETQTRRLLGSAFSTGDAYSHGLRALGCEAAEVICNADAAQSQWAAEHDIILDEYIHDRRRRIIAAQVDDFHPDVVYVFEWCPLGDGFLADLQGRVKLLVGEIASPLPSDRTFAAYDLMLSSWPPMVEHFRKQGITSEYFRLGFDERILERLAPRPTSYDVTFVGGFAPSHADRIPWLEALLAEIDVDVFCYGLENAAPSSPIRPHYRGQVWGWKMYETLLQSRITLNRHARIDIRGEVSTDWSNNLRLYEATGVGACLVTEWRPHLHQLFEPDVEVVTYRDVTECGEKIRYYLTHEPERAAVARAGQQRTIREHLYSYRMDELLGLFERQLRNGTPRANRSAVAVP